MLRVPIDLSVLKIWKCLNRNSDTTRSDHEDVKALPQDENDLKSNADNNYDATGNQNLEYNNQEKPISETGDPYQNANPSSKRPISQQKPIWIIYILRHMPKRL